jgi:NAD(P)-dependent dehydrogenase (short-subunit alcohol dehydrogenase family)
MSTPFESARTHPHGTDRLRGKICIVTGAGQGIGRATAHRLAAEGASVIAADMSEVAAERTVSELRARNATAERFVGDLLMYENCLALIDLAIGKFGRLDVLINNVGGATALKPYQEWEPREIQDEMNRSILPTLWCCRAALPHMLKQRYGRIVNVGAESVRNGLWDRAPYNVGKGGVIGLTTSIARETAPFGICCNCVSPGPTETERDRLVERGIRTKEAATSDYRVELSRKLMSTVPMNRRAVSEEHAAAIAFMASDDVGHITGQVLSAGGGMNML